jgi:hypothetical protein
MHSDFVVSFLWYTGDDEGDYFVWEPAPGQYILTAILYELPGGSGSALSIETVAFTVIDGPAPTPSPVAPTPSPVAPTHAPTITAEPSFSMAPTDN